jgi:hypothetical protein
MEYGRKIIYYVRNCEERSDKLTILKHDVFTIDFLTGAGVLYRVKMENRIKDNGSKVKITFYIHKVFKPFLNKNVP